ncbi:hypothetical protein LUZ60_003668 [Juncus effusus]|nr:hypothetical protein LUZ60_003668 [Juncus effusus]
MPLLSSLPPPPPLTTTSSSSSPPLSIRTNLSFSSISKTHSLSSTLRLFHLLPFHDTVTFNTAISAALRHRRPLISVRLFLSLLDSASHPDPITFRLVLTAVSELKNRALFVQIHGWLVKIGGFGGSLCESDLLVLGTKMIGIYCMLGLERDALKVFDEMPHKDEMAYSTIMVGLNKAGLFDKALKVFVEMTIHDNVEINPHLYSSALNACSCSSNLLMGKQIQAHVIKSGFESDPFVGTGLVDLYTKNGNINCAKIVLFNISEPNIISWNKFLAGNLTGTECLELFSLMRESGVIPDKITFGAVFQSLKDPNLSPFVTKQLHSLALKMIKNPFSDVFVTSALFDAYINKGCFSEAKSVVEQMKEKDDGAYNIIIQGAGLVEKGYKYFKYISNPTINHCACLIDMLGRAGRHKEAIGILTKMPFSPNENIYSSLLAASCSYKNIELGEYCAKELFKLNKKDSGNYIALSNLYASVGKWDKVREIRKLMRFETGKKERGVSWITRVNEGNIIFSSEKNVHYSQFPLILKIRLTYTHLTKYHNYTQVNYLPLN